MAMPVVGLLLGHALGRLVDSAADSPPLWLTATDWAVETGGDCRAADLLQSGRGERLERDHRLRPLRTDPSGVAAPRACPPRGALW